MCDLSQNLKHHSPSFIMYMYYAIKPTNVSTMGPLFLIQYRDPSLCWGIEPVVKDFTYSLNIFFSISLAAYFCQLKINARYMDKKYLDTVSKVL